MTRCLVVIDIQNDYFPDGAFPLVDPVEAATAARTVLDGFRRRGEPVVHLQHVWDEPEAAFFRPGTPGVEIHPLMTPADGETLIRKEYPNAFRGTPLQDVLRGLGAEDLVVVGMMTSLCVDATVRAAADLGHTVTVAGDACAAPDLEHGGRRVAGADVHAAFLAALDGEYATVVSSSELA